MFRFILSIHPAITRSATIRSHFKHQAIARMTSLVIKILFQFQLTNRLPNIRHFRNSRIMIFSRSNHSLHSPVILTIISTATCQARTLRYRFTSFQLRFHNFPAASTINRILSNRLTLRARVLSPLPFKQLQRIRRNSVQRNRYISTAAISANLLTDNVPSSKQQFINRHRDTFHPVRHRTHVVPSKLTSTRISKRRPATSHFTQLTRFLFRTSNSCSRTALT